MDLLMHEYYKRQLTPQAQRIYDQLLEKIHEIAKGGSCELRGWYDRGAEKDACAAYMALRTDCPEYFFLGNEVEVSFLFPRKLIVRQNSRFTYDQIKRINALLRARVRTIVESSRDVSICKTEKNIYRNIAKSYRYKEGTYAHDLSGLLLYKEGVCEALSGLLVVALREAGIPAIKVHGVAKRENHCWTKAWINGQPYHLDVTWDLAYMPFFNHFRYFNVTEDVIKRDHKIVDTSRY